MTKRDYTIKPDGDALTIEIAGSGETILALDFVTAGRLKGTFERAKQNGHALILAPSDLAFLVMAMEDRLTKAYEEFARREKLDAMEAQERESRL